MVTWGQLIWVFFPIPIICLLLLFVLPDKTSSAVVKRVFFTQIIVGPVRISLLWLFIHLSLLVFAHTANKVNKLQYDTMPYIFDSEGMWYKRAQRYRAERNFWLSLFNIFLWFLVWKVHALKQNIAALASRLDAIKLSSEIYGSGTEKFTHTNMEEATGRETKKDE